MRQGGNVGLVFDGRPQVRDTCEPLDVPCHVRQAELLVADGARHHQPFIEVTVRVPLRWLAQPIVDEAVHFITDLESTGAEAQVH